MNLDAYFKKEIAYPYEGRALRFRVGQDLFSSFDVDAGTKLLLRTLDRSDRRFRRVLDFGCGYGPLGLALKSSDPTRSVHMVDRDALAVDFTRENARLNDLNGVEVYGSLGFDEVQATDFNLIVANLPGKAGEPVIAHLLRAAAGHLAEDGLVAVVIVSLLAETVAGVLDATPELEVSLRRDSPSYAVFHYRVSSPAMAEHGSGFDRGVYRRSEVDHSDGGIEYEVETAYGLPEFDSPGYLSHLLMSALVDMRDTNLSHAVVLNPGVGHVAVALWKTLAPESIALVDRDLLGLRYSKANLARHGCPEEQITVIHRIGLNGAGNRPADLVLGVLRESEPPAAHAALLIEATELLAPDGRVLVASTSTAATRVAKYVQSRKLLRVVSRRRRKGNTLLVLQR